MKTNEIKDQEQAKAINTWLGYNCRGTLELCTSFGKTLTGLKAAYYFIKQNPNFRVLVLTPTEAIRDTVWVDEAERWGLGNYFEKNFRTECIQTARTWKGTKWDMVIADEWHNYLSEENREFFSNNKIDRLLGLTAKVPREKWHIGQQICPVVYRMTIQEAREKGIVSKYAIYNLPVKLTAKEQIEYKKIDNAYNYYVNLCGGPQLAYSNAKIWKKTGTDMQKKYANGYSVQMARRMRFLYDTQNKMIMVNKLLDHPLLKDKKAITFTQSKKVAHSLATKREDTVHYYAPATADKAKGLFLTRKQRVQNLIDFKNLDSVRNMAAVKALNEGADVPKISLALLHSGTASEKDFIQRVGRAVRLAEEDKIAVIINLFISDTQEKSWVDRRLGAFKDESIWVKNLQHLEDHLESLMAA